MNKLPSDISKFARSTGLLIDRCMQREQPFATAWLVAENQVVTCAHNVVLYMDFLSALKVRFPGVNQDWEVSEACFHPRFDQKNAHELALRSLQEPVSSLSLQDQNLVILKLDRNLSELDSEAKTAFNRKLGATPPPTRLKGLAGPIDELGLALVIQTLTNSHKDGCLIISDERNRPVAKLFCRDGKVVFAKYGNLHNESAVYQMFNHGVVGQFQFQKQTKPDWDVFATIERNTDSLLLEAHRRMDELPALLSNLGACGSVYVRAVDILDLEVLSPEVQVSAEKIWPYLDAAVSIDSLWEIVDLDDYSVFKAIEEMYGARQIIELPYMGDEGLGPMLPLEMAPHMMLSPWDEVYSLSAHESTGRAQIRRGNLVGLIRPNDPWHLLHNINLPYRGSGSPIFKDGAVVGIHCGNLPLDPKLYALPNIMSQMIWVESVHQMLSGAASAANLRPGKNSVGLKAPELSTLALSEKNKVQCPKCFAQMIKQAKFCGTCGHRIQL